MTETTRRITETIRTIDRGVVKHITEGGTTWFVLCLSDGRYCVRRRTEDGNSELLGEYDSASVAAADIAAESR